ncbi:uncharacterized protein LOC132944770 [Metopolophium dirhodum]|uniref:uncharacterized protein LOC132944770 n=1 Tax=Metopolophium dirhodum TaxID=44670 RepID=UPI0029905E2A|nr:uncharacterized protein LOC132944770 [Metopolophium dirhodum]
MSMCVREIDVWYHCNIFSSTNSIQKSKRQIQTIVPHLELGLFPQSDSECNGGRTIFGGEMQIISDCYGYMRLTHVLAVCWGMPITRRRTADDVKSHRGSADVHDGYSYKFDPRVVPVWLAYVALDAFLIYYNYLEASGYVGKSLRKCFEDSYCFAVIELANRNVGPFSALACIMFYGRRHKAAALAGTERTLAFIRDTDPDVADGGHVRPPDSRYYSAAVMAAYTACIWLYVAAVPAYVILAIWLNALGQTTVYGLATFQYHVLGRGYARVNKLLEMAADVVGHCGRPAPDCRTLANLVARLADTCDDFGRQVGHLNHAYVPGLLLRWPYSMVRLTMVVFRIIELSAAVRDDRPFARVAAVLIVEHVGEILLFLVQLCSFCYAGACLSYQARVWSPRY